MTERGPPGIDGPRPAPSSRSRTTATNARRAPTIATAASPRSQPAPRALAHQEAYCLSSAFPVCPTFQDWARREAAQARRAGEPPKLPPVAATAVDDPDDEAPERAAAPVYETPAAPEPAVADLDDDDLWAGRRHDDDDPGPPQPAARLGRAAALGDRRRRRARRRAAGGRPSGGAGDRPPEFLASRVGRGRVSPAAPPIAWPSGQTRSRRAAVGSPPSDELGRASSRPPTARRPRAAAAAGPVSRR